MSLLECSRFGSLAEIGLERDRCQIGHHGRLLLRGRAAGAARKSGSSKALLNVAVAVADRILGKPVQTVVEASDGYEALAALMAGDDDDDKDSD